MINGSEALHQVRVIEPDHSYHGQIGHVEMIYYDYQHTGSSPDLLFLTMPDGKTIRVLSTAVEEERANA